MTKSKMIDSIWRPNERRDGTIQGSRDGDIRNGNKKGLGR